MRSGIPIENWSRAKAVRRMKDVQKQKAWSVKGGEWKETPKEGGECKTYPLGDGEFVPCSA